MSMSRITLLFLLVSIIFLLDYTCTTHADAWRVCLIYLCIFKYINNVGITCICNMGPQRGGAPVPSAIWESFDWGIETPFWRVCVHDIQNYMFLSLRKTRTTNNFFNNFLVVFFRRIFDFRQTVSHFHYQLQLNDIYMKQSFLVTSV